MKDVNKVILVGRLGADPIRRETKSGLAVVHFPLATSRKIKDSEPTEGEYPAEETQWHKIVVWGKPAQACAQYLRKGRPVYIEGNVRSHRYSDKEGIERTSFEIHCEDISFLGPIGSSAGKAGELEAAP